MRAVVFRVLAGLLTALFAAYLVFGDTAQMSLRQLVAAWAIAIGFGLYAALGNDIGELLIWRMFGRSDLNGQKRRPHSDKSN
jgi:hypothetical protein